MNKRWLIFIFVFLILGSNLVFAQIDSTLLGYWRLMAIKNQKTGDTIKSERLKTYRRLKKPFFYIVFGEKRMSFRLDVNDCQSPYQLLGNHKIIINEGKGDFFCTRVCCDQLRFKYYLIEEYRIKGETLELISPEEIFIFQYIPDFDKLQDEMRED